MSHGATALAQNGEPQEETRVALIIGNSSYKVAPLANPANDANDLAYSLEKKGFTVLVRENVGERGLKEAVDTFAKYLKKGGVGLFFFAGHGIQLKDQNFLVPIDISFDSESDIAFKSVSAEYVLARMAEAGNRVNIVILDACRNNPLQQSRASISRGLGVMNVGRSEKGTFIAYATSPGATAADGKGRNGMYTKYLLQSLATPESDVDKVFGRVRTAVVQETGGEQVPWTSSSLIGSFYFDPVESRAARQRPATVMQATEEAVETVAAYDPAQEKALWESIKDSRRAEDYIGYLERFAGSPRAAYARWMAQKYGGDAQQLAAIAKPPARDKAADKAPPAAPAVEPQTAPTGAQAAAGTVIRDCDACPEMVTVAGGEYVMGSGPRDVPREPDEEPPHRVRISGPLAVGRYEVTRGQYAAFARETGRAPAIGCHSTRGGRFHKNAKASWQNPGFAQKDDEPVVCVSWEEAQAYVVWLSKKTGKAYRLPSEAEWEYLARAGSGGARYWADAAPASVCRHANVADASAKSELSGQAQFPCTDGFSLTAPVGRFPANPFGLFDMLGNAWEWVEDCWNEGYAGAGDTGAARLTGSCGERVFRGGAWNSKPDNVRAAYRDRESKDERHDNLGFRVIRSLP